MRAEIVQMEGDHKAIVLVYYNEKFRSYMVKLRQWRAPTGELLSVLDECPEISNQDQRKVINDALLAFQEYGIPYEGPGHADH